MMLKVLTNLEHQVVLADQQCWRYNLSLSCWMLVLVTFGLPQNVPFPRQEGHMMEEEICIACFNAEALQDQSGHCLPFSTLPRLSKLNFLLQIDAHLQRLQQDRLQSHLPHVMDTEDSTAVQWESCPMHEFEMSTCIRAGLSLKSKSILWLTNMGKLLVFWEALNFSQIFILLWRAGKMWLQNEKKFREGLGLFQVMFCLHFYVSDKKKKDKQHKILGSEIC